MPKYQIEFNRGASLKSYKYFIAEQEENPYDIACQVANDSLKTYNGKAPKVLTVREWDRVKVKPKRGGIKFKLHLTFIELTTQSGNKERDYWYQYND
jgi:hypothetical protein